MRDTNTEFEVRPLPNFAGEEVAPSLEPRQHDWRTGLNASQAEAAATTEGPLLVIAGAGTGKTRVIEHRVLHLLRRGVPPEQVLLLTFTRRAAREMLTRVAAREPAASRICGGTYHAFAADLLRRHAPLLGLPRSFSVLDPDDTATAVGRCIARCRVSDGGLRFPRKETVRDVISKATNTRLSITTVLEQDLPHYTHFANHIERVREAYVRYKLDAGVVDFDDLLVYALVVLRQPPIAAELARRHRYVLVDEYQDTNWLQGEITRRLGAEHGNVMVVGDDAQAIYSFRGARRENILQFADGFHGHAVKVIKLEENYRSVQPILDLANGLLANMARRFDKRLRSASDDDGATDRPHLLRFADATEEAEHVAAAVLRARDEGVALGEHAILYRTASQANEVQVSLAARRIPYRVFGGLRLSELAHVKDVLAVLRIAFNPQDALSWARVLELHEGVGPRIADQLSTAASRGGPDADVALAAAQEAAGRRPAAKRAVRWVGTTLRGLQGVPAGAVGEAFALVLEQYRPLLELNYDDHPRRWDDLQSLEQVASRYARVEDLVTDLSLDPPQHGRHAGPSDKEDEQPVTLSTIHSAKGLEWGHVHVIGLSDGRLPSARCLADPEAIEEEHRLLYVAVTRARRQLTLSMCADAFGMYDRLSRFLDRPDILALVDQAGDVDGASPARLEPASGATPDIIRASMSRDELITELRALDPSFVTSSTPSAAEPPRDIACAAGEAVPSGEEAIVAIHPSDEANDEDDEEFPGGYPF